MAQITSSNDLYSQLGIFSIVLGLMFLLWGTISGISASTTEDPIEAEILADLTMTIALVIGGGSLFIGGSLLVYLSKKTGHD